MEDKDISQIAFERIKESGIKPISKNVFNLKRVIFWSLAGFSVLIGVVSFAVTLYILFNNDWYLYNKFGPSFILKSLPYFWVLCLLVFTILGDYYYRKTFLGYRHRMITIMGVYIILTIVFGSTLYLLGVGETIEQSLSDNIPIYHIVVFDRNELWSHPEFGLIKGRIIDISEDLITIADFNDNIWVVNTDNTNISDLSKFKIGEVIKVIGDKDNDEIINADDIR
jgi:hypothetical protein